MYKRGVQNPSQSHYVLGNPFVTREKLMHIFALLDRTDRFSLLNQFHVPACPVFISEFLVAESGCAWLI